MKSLVSFLVLSLFVFNANAAQNSRPVMSNKIMSAPRYTASIKQLNTAVSAKNSVESTTETTETEPEEEIDVREAERSACLNNNIGIGNTFVWASRYSDTSNYANMIEDTTNPQNNVCFARVELKSNDESRISVSDIEPKYVVWGDDIECGSWVDKDKMEKRILDAKKGARIGGIVASTVGGAGLGVGAMELFGNKLIGGKVQGQKSLSETELYRSQLLVLKEKDKPQYDAYVENLKTIKEAYAADSNSVPEYNEKYKALIEEFVGR